MWPFLSNDLFPPPTEAWLQKVSSDPEAQGWGAWGRTKKTPLGPGAGSGTESDEEDEDAGFLLAMLEQENLPKSPVYTGTSKTPIFVSSIKNTCLEMYKHTPPNNRELEHYRRDWVN